MAIEFFLKQRSLSLLVVSYNHRHCLDKKIIYHDCHDISNVLKMITMTYETWSAVQPWGGIRWW